MTHSNHHQRYDEETEHKPYDGRVVIRWMIGVLILIGIFLAITGCTFHGQSVYDQTTGRTYFVPDGIAFFNPLEKKTD